METEDILTAAGNSQQSELSMNTNIKVEQDDSEYLDSFNSMDFLELATSCDPANEEPIEFTSSEAMINPKTGLMICLHCSEEVQMADLYHHMVVSHQYRRINFKCWHCNIIFKEQKMLNTHVVRCKQQPKRKGKKTFPQMLKEVDDLLAQGIHLEVINCPVCFCDVDRELVKQHVLLHDTSSKQEVTTCDKCNRTFKTKLTLREHIKLVHLCKLETEVCDLCGQKFRSQKYLSNHKRNVHPKGDKIHQCEICEKTFKSKLCLHQHMKYVHPPESASAYCHLCPKVFKTRVNLGQHLKISHGCYTGVPKDAVRDSTTVEDPGSGDELEEENLPIVSFN